MRKDIVTQKEIKEYIRRWKEISNLEKDFDEYKKAMRNRLHAGAILEEGPVTLGFTEFKRANVSYKEVVEKVKTYLGDKADMGKGWAVKLLDRVDLWQERLTSISEGYLITPKEVGVVKVLKTARIAR